MSLVFDRPLLSEQLTMAATEVLETMFFASVDTASDEAESPVGDRIGASLDFHGACAGRLALSLDRATAEGLASNFFGGVGEGGAEEDSQSVMVELTNMVCGAMLSHLDRNSIFCLDTPKQLEPGQEPTGEIVRDLSLEDGLLRLAFSLQESAPKVDAH
ncbi:MAG: chemotaxis protein CheX [Acidobacteria bacterium]|nr:chemotaxis protein CheX [Acidobacteriota bacterium]